MGRAADLGGAAAVPATWPATGIGPRWALVAGVLLAIAVLVRWAATLPANPADLGLTVANRGEAAVVAAVRYGGPAWEAGVRAGDRVETAAASGGAGGDVLVRSQAGPDIRVVAGGPASGVAGALGGMALLMVVPFVAVGCGVFLLAEDAAAALALLGVSVGAAAIAIGTLPNAAPTPAGGALAAVGLRLLGGALLALFLRFPVDRALGSRAGVAVLRANLAAVAGAIVLEVWWRQPSARVPEPWLEAFAVAGAGLLAAQVVGAGGLAVLAARAGWRGPARQGLLLVALGTLVGFGPLIALSVLPAAFGRGPLPGVGLAVAATPLFPLTLGAAVLGRQAFGITRFVRRGLVALVVWTLLVGVCSLAVVAAWSALAPGAVPDPVLVAVAVAAVAAGFPVAQSALRRGLARVLFRDVYDYAGTLRDLSTEIAGLSGVEAVARHVLARLGGTIDLAWAEVAIDPGDGLPLAFRWAAAGDGDDSGAAARLRLRLVADGAAIGTLALGPKRRDVDLLPEDRELAATIAPLLARALQGGLLMRRLEERVAALAERERELAVLSTRLMGAQEDERRRLALDLHDDPLQRAILLERDLASEPPTPRLARWREATAEVVLGLRAIAEGLRPPVLDDFGLVAALDRLANDVRGRSDDVTVTLVVRTDDGTPFGRLPPELETALFRVTQEALSNCLKHAAADTIAVDLRRSADAVVLRVEDDGRGYGLRAGATGAPGIGLLGMRERLRPWGGTVRVEAAGPAGGTVVTVAAPWTGGRG
jgi:signal transduction histidine kinase